MTRSYAILPVPQIIFDKLNDLLQLAGLKRRQGDLLDVSDIKLISDGNHHSPDMLINSGRLSDFEVALGEEAFGEGFAAGIEFADRKDTTSPAPSCYEAWSAYTPSETLLDMQDDL